VFISALAFSITSHAEKRLNVVVIAHSFSTRSEAREVLRRQGWTKTTNLSQADAILVVCRSARSWPLNNSYSSIEGLNSDAESLYNMTASNFHIYIYRINDDLSVNEIKHDYYPANE